MFGANCLRIGDSLKKLDIFLKVPMAFLTSGTEFKVIHNQIQLMTFAMKIKAFGK